MSKTKLNVVNRVLDTQTTYMTCAFQGYNGHKGVDLVPASTSETPYILAFADGDVISTGNVKGVNSSTGTAGCGTFVAIRHNDGSITRYQHLKYNSLRVQKGSKVKKGQIIGVYSRPEPTGNAKGCHLHFDISFPYRKGDNCIYGKFCGEARYYIDPVPYLEGSADKPQAYKVLRDVNIRDKNSLNGKIVGEYKKGDKVFADSIIGSWLHTAKGWSNNNNGYYFKLIK